MEMLIRRVIRQNATMTYQIIPRNMKCEWEKLHVNVYKIICKLKRLEPKPGWKADRLKYRKTEGEPPNDSQPPTAANRRSE